VAYREADVPEENEPTYGEEVAAAVVACVAHFRDLEDEQVRRVLRALAACYGVEPDDVACTTEIAEPDEET